MRNVYWHPAQSFFAMPPFDWSATSSGPNYHAQLLDLLDHYNTLHAPHGAIRWFVDCSPEQAERKIVKGGEADCWW